MYSEGASDLMDLIMMYPFKPAEHKQTHLSTIEQKAKDRFLPVFEKVQTVKHYSFSQFEAWLSTLDAWNYGLFFVF